MKTKSRATAAAASTDAAAAVAKRSNPRGLAKKRRGRFLPRAIYSVLASLSKLKLGMRTPVSSEKKTTAARAPRAKKPSPRAKRARSRRARATRPEPESARKPAPDSEREQTRSSATPPGWRKKNAEQKPRVVGQAATRPAKPTTRGVRKKKKASPVRGRAAACPSAPAVTTRAVMRRYARSAFARDHVCAERDALVQQGFPVLDTHGSVLDASRTAFFAASPARAKTKKNRRRRENDVVKVSPSKDERTADRSEQDSDDDDDMQFSPHVTRCDDSFDHDAFGTMLNDVEPRGGEYAARLPAEVFGLRDVSCEERWIESDPEGADDAWERGTNQTQTDEEREDMSSRDAILRSPVAWTPASPPRRGRGARREMR